MPRPRTKLRPGGLLHAYRLAIAGIADNDEPTIEDADEMYGYASVMVVAIAFRVSQMTVARHVVRFRTTGKLPESLPPFDHEA